MRLTIYTDGGSLNNPGPSASAYVILKDKDIVTQEGLFIGHATNNQAEYSALIFAFEKVKELISDGQINSLEGIDVIADSELLVRQVNGLYKIKNPFIRDSIMKIRVLESELNVPITYTHTLREGNQLADSLVKKALRQEGYSI